MRTAQAIERSTANATVESPQQIPARKLILAALPFAGIGAAVASVAWLPPDNLGVDSGILAIVVCLGAFGMSRLLSLAK